MDRALLFFQVNSLVLCQATFLSLLLSEILTCDFLRDENRRILRRTGLQEGGVKGGKEVHHLLTGVCVLPGMKRNILCDPSTAVSTPY